MTKAKKVRDVNFEPSEKFIVNLPNGITVVLESCEKDINDLANLGVEAVNSILTFNDQLKSKIKMVYREVNYRGEGKRSLEKKLEEIKERNEEIIRFEIITIG